MISGMEINARPVTAVSLPAARDGPLVPGVPGRRLVTTRTDTTLAVYDLGRPAAGDHAPLVAFPAPWPRGASGVDAVAPGLDLAVFAGLHAVRGVTPDGLTRWEVPHSCWGCEEFHETADEYAGDPDHKYPDQGSACFGTDGRTVWAHVRERLDEDDDPRGESSPEAWLVIDPADGTVVARAGTGTYAAGSHHLPHPTRRSWAWPWARARTAHRHCGAGSPAACCTSNGSPVTTGSWSPSGRAAARS